MLHPFSDAGELGAQLRAFDWGQTSLGPLESWPAHLRCSAAMVLENRFPMALVGPGPDCPALDEPVYVDCEMWETIVANLPISFPMRSNSR